MQYIIYIYYYIFHVYIVYICYGIHIQLFMEVIDAKYTSDCLPLASATVIAQVNLAHRNIVVLLLFCWGTIQTANKVGAPINYCKCIYIYKHIWYMQFCDAAY